MNDLRRARRYVLPTMARRIRRLAVVVLVLLVAGTVALVLTTRPKLDDGRDEVDGSWTRLRAPLAGRYDQLAAVRAEMTAAGGGERAVTRELGTTLSRWGELRRAGNDDADAEAEAEAADRLEGLATRLQAVVSSSDRLRGVEALNQRIAEFQATTPPLLPPVKTYNDAVRDYQDERNGFLRSPVASVLGYDSRPQLLFPT
jgi:hypothetical protein